MECEPPGRGPVTGGRYKDGDRVPGGFGLEGGEAGESLREEGRGEGRRRWKEA